MYFTRWIACVLKLSGDLLRSLSFSAVNENQSARHVDIQRPHTLCLLAWIRPVLFLDYLANYRVYSHEWCLFFSLSLRDPGVTHCSASRDEAGGTTTSPHRLTFARATIRYAEKPLRAGSACPAATSGDILSFSRTFSNKSVLTGRAAIMRRLGALTTRIYHALALRGSVESKYHTGKRREELSTR